MFSIIKYFIFVFIITRFLEGIFFHRSCNFDIYFGVPGSGKTTFAAYLSKKRIKKHGKVYSNVPLKGSYEIVKSDVGKYDISNSLLILDEAGVDYNNRSFKNFTDEETYFFKFHRHYKVDIALFSQDYEDMDKKLRKLATRYYYVTRSFVPFCIKRKEIRKTIGIDKDTHQIIEKYYFRKLKFKLIFAPALWKSFDTYDRKKLPSHEFRMYGKGMQSVACTTDTKNNDILDNILGSFLDKFHKKSVK